MYQSSTASGPEQCTDQPGSTGALAPAAYLLRGGGGLLHSLSSSCRSEQKVLVSRTAKQRSSISLCGGGVQGELGQECGGTHNRRVGRAHQDQGNVAGADWRRARQFRRSLTHPFHQIRGQRLQPRCATLPAGANMQPLLVQSSAIPAPHSLPAKFPHPWLTPTPDSNT